jgi:hypothetical protein
VTHFFQVRDSDDLNDTADFTVIIKDINNNVPVFEFPNATTEIRLNIEVSIISFFLLKTTDIVLIMELHIVGCTLEEY